MSRQRYETVVANLASQLDFDNVGDFLDETLFFLDDALIRIDYLEDLALCQVQINLGHVPLENEDAVLRRMLESDFDALDGGHISFSIEPDSGNAIATVLAALAHLEHCDDLVELV